MTGKKKIINLHPSPATFPVPEMIETGLWAALSPAARAVLGALWDYHRKYPDACRPSRSTLAIKAGVSQPTVTRALNELEAVGIVKAIPSPGPRTNTYRLQWTGLLLPVAKDKDKKPTATSPFKLPTVDHDIYLTQNRDGEDIEKHAYTRRGSQLRRLADGCFVRSATEIQIHDYLVAWKVPHWADVRYLDLGIRMLKKRKETVDTTSTVDFVVAPGLILEAIGLPRSQAGARHYREKTKAKVAAARKKGWQVILVEPDISPGEWMFQAISDAWAKATIEDAEVLRRQMEVAKKLRDDHQPSRWLDAHIVLASGRLKGKIPPENPQGFYIKGTSKHGVPEDVRVKPKLVLMAEAGRTIPPVDADERDFFDDLVAEAEASQQTQAGTDKGGESPPDQAEFWQWWEDEDKEEMDDEDELDELDEDKPPERKEEDIRAECDHLAQQIAETRKLRDTEEPGNQLWNMANQTLESLRNQLSKLLSEA